MLLFLTFRYGKNFVAWKAKQLQEIDVRVKMASMQEDRNAGAQSSVAAGSHAQTNKSKATSVMASRHEQIRHQTERLENQVL